MKTEKQIMLDLMNMILKHPNHAELGAALHKYVNLEVRKENLSFYDKIHNTLGMSNTKTY